MRSALLLALALAAFPAFSDDASFGGDGATVFALKNDQIRMASEKISIHALPKGLWRADCEFHFENTSEKEVSVQMGFPDWKVWGELPDQWAIQTFTAQVDGQPVTPTHKEVAKGLPDQKKIDYQGAYTWPVSFAAKGKHTVLNSYEFRGLSTNGPLSACLHGQPKGAVKDAFFRVVKKPVGGWDYEDSLCSVVKYIVTTANTWRGPIGEAEISMEWDARFLPHQALFIPAATEVTDKAIRWHFENWKPTGELSVVYLRPPIPDSAKSEVPQFDNEAQVKAWLAYAKKNHFQRAAIERVADAVPKFQKRIKGSR